ncbi:MAG: outer membrane protein assembly factor BamA [Gammaproteobacteria bacterium]|nr:outer membrane protein assembly factor BamA [Gammaproteobacteria bacterium]
MKHYFSGNFLCRSLLRALIPLLLAGVVAAQSPDEFVVQDIRVEGLQRISEGTVFNYLPVNIGDRMNRQRLQEALRAVYATEFFKDIELRREGDILIIAVVERPSIADFTIDGNKDIKSEDLLESLSKVGLRKGRILNRSVLEDVERSLTEEYFARGKYAAAVETEIEELPDNKVEINIQITEGDRARIRQINIVGNTAFDDEELLEVFELRTPHWLSWMRQDDRYSKEALQGDLETLRSYYMDRGYADFVMDSVQVAISPDKQDIYITLNIVEGEIYKVADVKLAGELILPEAQLQPYVAVRPGQIFSQRLLTSTEEWIQLRLGEEGYAFTEVEPVTDLDKDSREVDVTFYVDPKNRVYVRRINFEGADSVNDEVFRREMRQFEGGFLSKNRVDRSKIRLQRLPYIEDVEVETVPVPGTPDLVDVNFDIKEGLPGQFGGGIGYSDSQGVLLNGNFVHTNFMGTGNRVQVDANFGEFRKIFAASYTNPYITQNEISATFSGAYRESTQFTSEASDLDTTTVSAGITLGYPVTEYQRVSLGINYQGVQLDANTSTSSAQALEWVINNGDTSFTCVPLSCDDSGITPTTNLIVASTEFNNFELAAGWSWDTRNRALFADRGWRHSLGASITIPGSEVEFASFNYNYKQYLPLTRYFTVALTGEVGYAKAIGDTTSVPPYKNYFAGGPNTVRGFREDSLGPLDTRNNPYGGNLLIAGSAELILPIPRKWAARSRFTLFYDTGNVFSTEDSISWFDAALNPLPADFYEFDLDKLRSSVGISAEWLAPLGLFKFSYGIPLNESNGGVFNTVDGPITILEDEVERFQFTIGGAF